MSLAGAQIVTSNTAAAMVAGAPPADRYTVTCPDGTSTGYHMWVEAAAAKHQCGGTLVEIR
jgi:hypothetical protein